MAIKPEPEPDEAGVGNLLQPARRLKWDSHRLKPRTNVGDVMVLPDDNAL